MVRLSRKLALPGLRALAIGFAGARRPLEPPPARSAAVTTWLNAARDGDGDLVSDGRDRCPDAPEDRDDFEDDDGCPDNDNDRDGIADANDRSADGTRDCRDEPEKRAKYNLYRRRSKPATSEDGGTGGATG